MSEAIILVGGLGTRLQAAVSDRPKALALISGRPFLDYLFDYLAHYGITRVILSVCHKKVQIQDHYGSRYGNISIEYCEEKELLGTGGAIQKSLSCCESENVFVLNGDSILFVPLHKMMRFHEQTGAVATLAVRKVPEGNRYGSVTFDHDGCVQNFVEKETAGSAYINGGIYCMQRTKVGKLFGKMNPPFSIERDVFPNMILENHDIRAFPVDSFFIDIGVPESFCEAQEKLPVLFPIKG